MNEFDPKNFVEQKIDKLKNTIGNEKALVAISGGVDSTTCAVLTRLAIGEKLSCVTIDDGFRREGEPERVVEILSREPLNLQVKILNAKELVFNSLNGLIDAEEKRKKFREKFYKILSDASTREECDFLVQGTILADIIETKRGIKTQHNILEQIGINAKELYGFKVVEPLVDLLKDDVRKLARYLKIPSEISERQPFPGPGLLVRVVGEIKEDKLKTLKKVTQIVEEELIRYNPDQYFATIIDNKEEKDLNFLKKIKTELIKYFIIGQEEFDFKILQNRATGMIDNSRHYGKILTIKFRKSSKFYKPSAEKLILLQQKIISENPSISRILYEISSREIEKSYLIAVRAVKTKNFITADVVELPWESLNNIAQKSLESSTDIFGVYYDITPKPPATIEME